MHGFEAVRRGDASQVDSVFEYNVSPENRWSTLDEEHLNILDFVREFKRLEQNLKVLHGKKDFLHKSTKAVFSRTFSERKRDVIYSSTLIFVVERNLVSVPREFFGLSGLGIWCRCLSRIMLIVKRFNKSI